MKINSIVQHYFAQHWIPDGISTMQAIEFGGINGKMIKKKGIRFYIKGSYYYKIFNEVENYYELVNKIDKLLSINSRIRTGIVQ